MNTLSKLLFSISIMVSITSCSSTSDKIQDKWWYDVESYGDDIIKFTSDNQIQNINDKDVLTYEINGEAIKIKMRDYAKESEIALKKDYADIEAMNNPQSSTNVDNSSTEPEKIYIEETWSIGSINDKELVIKNGDKTRTFRLASDQDLFVGDWEGTKKGVEVKFEFDKKNKVEVRVKGSDKEEFTYSFNENKVVIDNDSYDFTLSEDKNNLVIKGKESFNLIRTGR
jgi:hypothetical protein